MHLLELVKEEETHAKQFPLSSSPCIEEVDGVHGMENRRAAREHIRANVELSEDLFTLEAFKRSPSESSEPPEFK